MEFEIIRNDITLMRVDAIVLPANAQLKEGSGTSNAIFEKAGRKLLEKECAVYGAVDIGSSVPTSGGNLEAKYILHTVVPKWIDGEHQEYALLSSAYFSALTLADAMGCKSIAFPLLASGNNGFDMHIAFEIAKESIARYQSNNKLSKVFLVVYGMRVVSMLKGLGLDVEERIDEDYVISQNENKKNMKQCAEDREEKRNSLGDNLDHVLKFVKDPENQKKIIEVGKVIAQMAIIIVKKKGSK